MASSTIRLTAAAVCAALLAGAAGGAAAQTPPATIGERYIPAPWWMREPVIASIGHVRAEIPANRASFRASFQAVERTSAGASAAAADKVRALSRALGGYGAEVVQVETTLGIRPLYEQYRDQQGNIRENARADQVERYQADAVVSVTVRDTAVLERVYATVLQAQPTSISAVFFNLEPDNATKTAMAAEAVRDAARRARQAAEHAGARLGAVKVIDPSGRACETDVLAGWPSYSAGGGMPTDVETIEVTGSRVRRSDFVASAPPPPPAPAADAAESSVEAARLALQPPIRELTERACVVYALGAAG